MPWSGGSYTKGNNATGGWTGDASLGIGIEAGRHDTQDNDFALGINQCLNKDGSNAATGPLNAGGFKLTNVATGVASTDAITLGQAQGGINTSGTALSITNTRFSADVSGSLFALAKSRGASVGTNTIVQSGDQIGVIAFSGANGTSYTTAAAIIGSVDGTPGATNDMPGALRFYTTPDGSGTLTERMIIKANGSVGIGTSSPAHALDVQGSLRLGADNVNSTVKVGRLYGQEYLTANADFLGIEVRGDSGSNQVVLGGGSGVYNCATEIKFITAANVTTVTGTERMRITSAGRVGVGTTSPSNYFTAVNSESNAIAAGYFQSNVSGDLATHGMLIVKYDNNSTTSQRLLGFYMNQGATAQGQINANGASQAAFGSFSDARLKENITDLPSQIANIMALRPVEFDYKDGSGHQIGFIAQEVENVYPDLIGDDGNGYLTLSGLGKNEARMIKAFQEFAQVTQDTIAALEARVAALEGA